MERVLQCIGSLGFGGSQTFIMEVYRKIDRNKIQFDFIVFPERKDGFYSEIQDLGGRVFVCPRFNGKNYFAFIKWWNTFFSEHREYKVIHGHVRSVALIYLSIAHHYGLTTIVHSHSTSNGSGVPALVKKILQYPLRYKVDYLFSCSDLAGKWLYGTKNVTKTNYRMVPNCIDCERFAFNARERNLIRMSMGITDDMFVLGHIGRFARPKNHSFLIKIFESVKKQIPNAQLILVGGGDGKKEIEQMVDLMGLNESVHFLGIQKYPEKYYQAMDVFVFPSLWEGLPMGVVEAQAAGLPCIISDKITTDVHLTELVESLPIDISSDRWRDSIVAHAGKRREGITPAQKVKLARFDSNRVAKELEVFYLELVRNA